MPEEINSKIEGEKREENLIRLNYDDLLKLLSYKLLSQENPYFESHFKNVADNIKSNIISGRANFKDESEIDFSKYDEKIENIEKSQDPDELLFSIRSFLKLLSERILQGEKIFAISDKGLSVLDNFDPGKSIEEQDEDIKEKVNELKHKRELPEGFEKK